ncbi:MAG: ABC transporter permease [Flavobacteriales bacterium]|nr:ABC transporter permease [Flavobacteriales bacterium]
MRYEFLLARKMIGGRTSGETSQSSSAIVKIAVAGIAIGMAVMLLSVGIVNGFQNEIQQKVIGFGSHLQISMYNTQNAVSEKPVERAQPFLDDIRAEPTVKNVNVYAFKSGIIVANSEIKGIIAKGVDQDYDWDFFSKNLVDGSVFSIPDSNKSDSVVLSKYVMDKLKLELGEKITVIFIQDEKERKRRFVVGGVYESGMDQFDANMMLCDIRHVQKLNNWAPNQVAGFEVTLNEFDDLGMLDEIISNHISWEFTTLKITDQFMEIFGWLELQDLNVVIILSLMVLVSGINMITALLVFILERTNMIGLLKALGATNGSLSKIFLYNAAYLILLGTFWGNLIGLSLGLLQKHFQILKLDKASYYIDHVPVLFEWDVILYINLGSVVISMLMLILPSMIVSRIDPVKTIRFN